jgi:hypothetical protein
LKDVISTTGVGVVAEMACATGESFALDIMSPIKSNFENARQTELLA